MSTKITISVTVETAAQTITHTATSSASGDNPAYVAEQVATAMKCEGYDLARILHGAFGHQYKTVA